MLRPYIIASRNLKITKLSGKVIINQPFIACIRIGYNDVGIIDYNYDRSLWQNTGTIIFDGKTVLGIGTKIACSGLLEFGANFIITGRTEIICKKHIKFGKNVLISWDNLIMDTDFHHIFHNNKKVNHDKEIIFSNNIWVGCRCLILKGAIISQNTVIGAGSIITKNCIKENCIYIDNKIVKTNISWKI